MKHNIYIYIAVMAAVTYLIRVLPLTIIRKKIKKVSYDTMVVAGDMTTNFNETCAGNKIVTAYN